MNDIELLSTALQENADILQETYDYLFSSDSPSLDELHERLKRKVDEDIDKTLESLIQNKQRVNELTQEFGLSNGVCPPELRDALLSHWQELDFHPEDDMGVQIGSAGIHFVFSKEDYKVLDKKVSDLLGDSPGSAGMTARADLFRLGGAPVSIGIDSHMEYIAVHEDAHVFYGIVKGVEIKDSIDTLEDEALEIGELLRKTPELLPIIAPGLAEQRLYRPFFEELTVDMVAGSTGALSNEKYRARYLKVTKSIQRQLAEDDEEFAKYAELHFAHELARSFRKYQFVNKQVLDYIRSQNLEEKDDGESKKNAAFLLMSIEENGPWILGPMLNDEDADQCYEAFEAIRRYGMDREGAVLDERTGKLNSVIGYFSHKSTRGRNRLVSKYMKNKDVEIHDCSVYNAALSWIPLRNMAEMILDRYDAIERFLGSDLTTEDISAVIDYGFKQAAFIFFGEEHDYLTTNYAEIKEASLSDNPRKMLEKVRENIDAMYVPVP